MQIMQVAITVSYSAHLYASEVESVVCADYKRKSIQSQLKECTMFESFIILSGTEFKLLLVMTY